MLRKFSSTSSQTGQAFKAAFLHFKDDASWRYVAEYVYGDRVDAVFGLEEESDDDVEQEESSLQPLKIHLETLFEQQLFLGEEDDPKVKDTLDMLLEFVDEDSSLSPDEAATYVQDFERYHFAIMKRILFARIPINQQGQVSDGLIKWFTYSNSAREFLFVKSIVLKEMMKKRNLKCAGTKISDMISVLSGEKEASNSSEGPPLEPKQAAIKAILSKSFQKPQKGAAREYCSLGHRMEKPILNNWINETKSDSFFPVQNLQVTSAYTVGLAGKRGQPHAKDSVDFHLHVSPNNGSTPNNREAWGFEAKGRLTVKTAFAEEDVLESLHRDKHVEIDDVHVHKNLKIPSERWQVLHHAHVYDYPVVVHAVGDSQGEIIQSTIIRYTATTKEHYSKVLQDLKELTLDWAYSSNRSPVKIPDEVMDVAALIPTINGSETLQGTANLWVELSNLPLPLPPLYRLIPAQHAYWNQTKSGSDTTTKLMDKCIAIVPHTTPESVACNRMMSLAFVVLHRLSQLYGSKPDLPYPSLEHYRNAASHRTTFHRTLLRSRQVFLADLKALSSAPATQTPPRAENQRPLREKTNNVQHERINSDRFNVPHPLPTKTPGKLSKKIKDGSAPDAYIHLDGTCKGTPFKTVDSMQQRCALCQAKTSWYCMGCKQWFCLEKKVKNDMSGVDTFGVGVKEARGKDTKFQVSCFHRKHLQNIDE